MRKPIVGVLMALALAVLLRPELSRYSAERDLEAANAAFDSVLGRPSERSSAPEMLLRVSERAAGAAPRLPGDSRGWVLAGSCQLIAGRTDRAREFYRRALTTGERAEIHLNLGRAEALLRRPEVAQAAFVRSIWISPALLRAVPPGFADPVSVEIARLEQALRAGRLTKPPPIPD
jgi:cytochrome c-type biogenesis protein CcmH/NrfG